MNGRETARDLAWMDLGLYWEHDWTAGGPTVPTSARAAWSKQVANEIVAYVDDLYGDAVIALGGLIAKSGTNPRFYAFNPLSWMRTDAVDFPYPTGSADVHVVDLTSGLEVPSQIVIIDTVRYLRVWAEDVPPVGYKVFEIVPGAGSGFGGAPTADNATGIIENDIYQLTVSTRGAITSLVDKTRGSQQFAQTIGGRAINDLGAGSGTLVVENAGPVSITLTATSSSPRSHTSSITLFRDGSSRIDIRNRITQNFGEVLTWSFGFNLTSPDTWHEEVGAIIRAKTQPNGGHYAPTHARYDWMTINHFADMTGNAGTGITLSNADLQYMNLGNSTPTTLDANTPQIDVLAGGQVDGPDLGIPNQNGDSQFLQRFALQTHDAYDPTAAMKFALEHQNPLVAVAITGGTQYPETAFTLLNATNPNVLLWALKPADDGINAGYISRWWNVASSAQTLAFSLPGAPLISAQTATHIETPTGSASVASGTLQANLAPQQIATFLMTTSNVANLPGVPVLFAPANQAESGGLQPTLSWGAAVNAVRYEVQLALDVPPDDAAPIFNATLTSYTAPTPLLALRTYYWRVRAANSTGALSTWSELRQFIVTSAVNSAPSRNYYQTPTPTLTWNRIHWAAGYEIQIAATTAFSVPVVGPLPADQLSYAPSSPLTEGTWFWRVRALHTVSPLNPGNWSAVQSFVIELP
jgi:alpha-mannosidase